MGEMGKSCIFNNILTSCPAEVPTVRIVRSLRIYMDICHDQSLRLIMQRLFGLFGLQLVRASGSLH